VDAETSGALNRTFVDRHVLVIGDQKFTPPQFGAAAQLFGELQRREHVHGYPPMYFVEPADRARQTLHFGAEEREGARGAFRLGMPVLDAHTFDHDACGIAPRPTTKAVIAWGAIKPSRRSCDRPAARSDAQARQRRA